MIRESNEIIIKGTTRILIPFIQLFALYVVMHGHYSPGGGFQGGVILCAGFVLMVITFGMKEIKKRVPAKNIFLIGSLGVLIYTGIGLLCLFLFGNFLDYGKLAVMLNVDPDKARSLGILGVEIGVCLVVMAVMLSIFLNITNWNKTSDQTKDIIEL